MPNLSFRRAFYGFAIATKGSKPHSHHSLLTGAQSGGGKRRRCPPNFQLQIMNR